jgi:hypothetical protein
MRLSDELLFDVTARLVCIDLLFANIILETGVDGT